MNHFTDPALPAVERLGRIHDLARLRADALRQQAIDDFWQALGTSMSYALGRSRRSAERLEHRIRRHAQLRG